MSRGTAGTGGTMDAANQVTKVQDAPRGSQDAPRARKGAPRAREITPRGIALGAAITVVFIAANVYMGLKTGMTFSSSIPAAMISMGCLRLLGGSSILENNIVQTQASAAGTLCNVILILPGLVLIGHWHGFPFWQTSAVCALGGLLGVAFSIPLRRALVTRAGLPYPEGVAAAEVLRTGEGEAGAKGLRDLLGAAAGAGAIGLATTGFRLLAEGMHGTLAAGSAVFRLGTGFSLALVGVGYLVGIGACLALLTGVAIAWGVAVPLLTALGQGEGASPSEMAEAVWSGQVRLIGAGIIAVGGLWTVGSLARPILGSIATALASVRTSGSRLPGPDHPRAERDLPITWVGAAVLALTLPLAWLFAGFASGAELGGGLYGLVAAATVFAVLFGFLMAATCGYLAGLLGSSSSPISGIGILTAMAAAVLLPLLVGRSAGPEGDRFVIAMALLVAAVIVTMASIANDNLQDLKTGQLVDATPWRQQVVLLIGVAVGAAVIGPLLSLLYEAYGFVGALPREGMEAANAMPAPQAALTSQIAGGIVHGTLPWTMVLIGAGLGAVLVAVEAWLRRRDLTFPALTVGIGMYLPLSVEMTIAVGGVLGWLAERTIRARAAAQGDDAGAATETARRRGVLLASGFLVGESFVGVILAVADTLAGRSASLALVGPGFAPYATWLGAAVFGCGLAVFYRLTARADLDEAAA
ncbi:MULTISPECIES: oligopeptide transporter, OPT family [unclassified Methylobacterium]|uniref:OPT family oligopeptide transporter n=3 Tax=Methylobacterium TaxID=407 RepID=UPI001FEDAD79|nr:MULTISPECIES: oligopeptide transporter, OPT family [unclassified Methylobacterium]